MNIALLALGILSIASVLLSQRTSKMEVRLGLDLMLFLLTGLLFAESSAMADKPLVFGGLAVVALSFALSRLSFLRKRFVSLLVPSLAAATLVFIFKDSIVEVGGNQTQLVNKFLLASVVIALFIFEVSDLKSFLIRKMKLASMEVRFPVELFVLGLAAYLSIFASSYFGLYLVTMLITSLSFFQKEDRSPFVHMLVALLGSFLAISESAESVSLLSGDVVLGLLVGAFLTSMSSVILEKRLSIAWGFAILFLTAVIAYLLVYAGSLFPSMGGPDALVALLIGAGLFGLLVSKSTLSVGIISVILITGMNAGSILQNDELDAFEEQLKIVKQDETKVVPDNELINLFADPGEFGINEDSSQILFELGNDVVTKGAFKKVKGAVVLSEDEPTKSSFNISLDMSDFTTFNKMRDKSLAAEDYFNSEKYPTMSYSGDWLLRISDTEHEIQGEFTMLGKTLKVPVRIARVKTSDNSIKITGSGKLDRTKFGMSPSASEGNVVRFTYSLLLDQK